MTAPFRFFPGTRRAQIRDLLRRFTTTFPGGAVVTFDAHDILAIDPHAHGPHCTKTNRPCHIQSEIAYLDPDADPLDPPRWFVTEAPDVLIDRLERAIAILAARGTP